MPLYEISNITNSTIHLPSPLSGKLGPRQHTQVDAPASHLETASMNRMVNKKLLAITSVGNSLSTPDNIETQVLRTVDDTVRHLYVSSTSGLRSNSGLTPGSPLKTIQEAANLFLTGPIQFWEVNDNRYIHVEDPQGTTHTESVVILPHAGPGALVIKGQETTVEEGLVLAGTPFTAIPGFEIDQTCNLSGGALVPSTYSYGTYLVPQVSFADTEYDASYDMLPVKDNAASSLTVTCYDPGIWSAFSLSGGALVDLVKPNITWRAADSTAFAYTNAPTITNLGGALIVRGFNVKKAAVGGSFGSFLNSGAGPGDSSTGSLVAMQRLHFNDAGFSTVVEGDSCSMTCVSFDDAATTPRLSSCQSFIAQNVAINTSLVLIEGAGDASLYGISVDHTNAGLGGFRVSSGTPIRHLAADIRASGAGNCQLSLFGVDCSVYALSVEGAGPNPAVACNNGSSVAFDIATGASRLVGTAGNTDVGVLVSDRSKCSGNNLASISLTGSAGDLKIGALAPQTWVAGANSDAIEFARFQT